MAAFAKNEDEIANRISRFLKAELKRNGLTYADHAESSQAWNQRRDGRFDQVETGARDFPSHVPCWQLGRTGTRRMRLDEL